MKFSLIFPDAKFNSEPVPSICLLGLNNENKCVICGEGTNWVDLDYADWFCGLDCLRKFEKPLLEV